jgi:nucleoside-diphosphate-sugar epimerase
MRVAITGASGFVGSHVLRELQARDLDIVVAGRSNARLTVKKDRTKFVWMDIAQEIEDPTDLMEKPDALIHLAWGGLPNYQSPHHVETELPLQQRFLDACLASGLKRLVVTGTCFEYGMLSGAIAEANPTAPCTQYGIAKKLLLQHLQESRFRDSIQLGWLRLFYLFGAGQSKNSLYASLTAAVMRGDPTFEMSGGEQIRDFMPIQEAARIIVDITLMPTEVGVVNVCSGKPLTVREIAKMWTRGMSSEITLDFGRLPYSKIEPMSFWGDRSKLDSLLNGKWRSDSKNHVSTVADSFDSDRPQIARRLQFPKSEKP